MTTGDNTVNRSTDNTDQFIKRNGLEFAGTHLLVDFWGASHLDDLELMQAAMRESVAVAGARLLLSLIHI